MDTTYQERRGELEAYFDRTASDAWAKLTSDAPVSGIRATVREGRDRMRSILRSWMPVDVAGRRILDAGCGTGSFSILLTEAGASVTAIDLSATLVDVARNRAESLGVHGIDFRVGDMLSPSLGEFDFVVAMDSLIHYEEADMVDVVSGLSARAIEKVLFTFAPRTLPLSAMHFAGRFFPRGNRSPAIEPIGERRLANLVSDDPRLSAWRSTRTQRVSSGFYTSQAMELTRST